MHRSSVIVCAINHWSRSPFHAGPPCAKFAYHYRRYWYPSTTGIVACPEDPTSCPAPPEWYPDLTRSLGAPLGPRTLVSPYVWSREFEHATVHLDLNRPNASAVTFKTTAEPAGSTSVV